MSLVAWSVCLSLGTQVIPAKTAKPIEMQFGADSRGRKELCFRWGSRSFHGNQQLLWVVRLTKSLLRCTQQKRSFSSQ